MKRSYYRFMSKSCLRNKHENCFVQDVLGDEVIECTCVCHVVLSFCQTHQPHSHGSQVHCHDCLWRKDIPALVIEVHINFRHEEKLDDV